jgi:type I restriction enzyme S subunit
MSDDWKVARISDVAIGVYDGPHATPPLASEGAIYLGIGNITEDGHLDLQNVRYIADADLARWTKRVTPQPGDLSCPDQTGQSAWVADCAAMNSRGERMRKAL